MTEIITKDCDEQVRNLHCKYRILIWYCCGNYGIVLIDVAMFNTGENNKIPLLFNIIYILTIIINNVKYI